MKKVIIGAVLVGILCLVLVYCSGPYYVINEHDMVKNDLKPGQQYLYSHNWLSANPFNKPIVHTITILSITHTPGHKRWQYVKFRFDDMNGLIYSRPLKGFKGDLRRMDFNKHLKK